MARQFKQVLFPREHGAWGMVSEAIVAGCIVGPSWAGAAVAVAAIGAFLSRRAISVGWILGVARNDPPLRRRARLIGGGLVVLAAVMLGVGLMLAANRNAALAVVGGVGVLGAIEAVLERRRQGRSLWGELIAAGAMAALGALIVTVGPPDVRYAVAIGVLLATRQMLAIIYIRHRIRAARSDKVTVGAIWVYPVIGAGVLGGLWSYDAIGWLATAAVAMILVRGISMHLSSHRPTTPKRIGMTELAIGLAYTLLISIDAWVR